MSAAVQPFDFHGTQVRIVTDADGAPWFVAADVATVLELGNVHSSLATLDDDEKGLRTVETPGGPQSLTAVSEAGLYSLVLRSRKPEAKTFKRWITHEVLPAIRRTGTYSVPAVDLSSPQGMVALAEQYLNAAKALVQAEARIEYLEPRAQVADHILDASGDLSVGDAAKELARAGIEIGQQRLFRHLERLGWTYRAGDRKWRVKQAAIETGRLAVLPQSHYHPVTGELVIDPPQVRVTPKGLTCLLDDLIAKPRLEVLA